MAGVNSDLLEIELYISEALRRVLATGSMTTDEIETQSHSIDLMIRLAKQITQIANLEMRSRKAKGEEEGCPIRPK